MAEAQLSKHRRCLGFAALTNSVGRTQQAARGKDMGEIRHLIPIAAPPAKVYAALASQSGLRGWWTADSTADEREGGRAEFGFEKRAMVFRMTIATLDPDKAVVWVCQGDSPEWRGTTLSWNIEPQNGGCRLRFTQSGWREMTDYVAACNSTLG
jgi:uncharacterized protein YndB with AHSA1/START domain